MTSLTTPEKSAYYGKVRASASRVLAKLQLTTERIAKFSECDEAELDAAMEKLVSRFSALSLTEEDARSLMGCNFLGSAECEKHFGIKLEEVPAIPFAADDVRAAMDTHILVLVPALSVEEIRAKHTKLFYAKKDAWYANDPFAIQKPDKAEWHLVRKHPVQNSTSKTWGEQQALLRDGEIVPTARVLIYTIIAHFLNHGERLFERIYVRCSDLSASGYRVYVGYFGADGLGVGNDWDGDRGGFLGVASSRKSN